MECHTCQSVKDKIFLYGIFYLKAPCEELKWSSKLPDDGDDYCWLSHVLSVERRIWDLDP